MEFYHFYLSYSLSPYGLIVLKLKIVQTTLRVVENLGGRVFSTTGSFSTIGSAQKHLDNFKAKLYLLSLANMKWTINVDDDYYFNQIII